MRNPTRERQRAALPQALNLEGKIFEIQNGKIPFREIFRSCTPCRSLVELYRQRVLTQQTRTIRLLGRKHPAKILNTLLGFEVQASYKRIQCPDLVTARYIRLFSEIGCHSIQLPYDPTQTADLIPEFERLLEAIVRQIHSLFQEEARIRQHSVRQIFACIRRELRSPL